MFRRNQNPLSQRQRKPQIESLQARDLMSVSPASTDWFSTEDVTSQSVEIQHSHLDDIQPVYGPALAVKSTIQSGSAPTNAANNASTDDIRAHTVFGPDGRGRVENTTQYWPSAAGRLWTEYPDGSQSSCSGAMISEKHFLTAGHCVFSTQLGGWPTRGTVSLGQQGDAIPGSEAFRRSDFQPFGEANVVNIRAPQEWTNSEDLNHDWAVITLDRNIGNLTGWFGYGYAGDHHYLNQVFDTAGYPSDRNDANGDGVVERHDMYHAADTIISATPYLLGSGVDSHQGQSGGPLFEFDPWSNLPYIHGVVSHEYRNGAAPNQFTRISAERFDLIQGVIAEDWGISTVDQADLTDHHVWFNETGISFPNEVVTGGQIEVKTAVRNNGTAIAGNFDVNFVLSTDEFIDRGDTVIGKVSVNQLNPFESVEIDFSGSVGNVPAGNYYLAWVIDANDSVAEYSENDNVIQTTQPITVLPGTPAVGSIEGRVWNDANANGRFDGNESGLAGWTVYLDTNQNGSRDNGEPQQRTAGTGTYKFEGLSAGTYTVAVQTQDGWEATTPKAPLAAVATKFVDVPEFTTEGSTAPIYAFGQADSIAPQTTESGSLIGLDRLHSDSRFRHVDGSGFAVVVLDTGIDLDHPAFGSDRNGDRISDRIVYHQDFTNSPFGSQDKGGHGSNVSSIIGSELSAYPGVAPGVDIIHLKVLGDDGQGSFGWVEEALQWVARNASTYNIASVNLSLGNSENYQTPQSLFGLDDEMAALSNMNVIVTSAAGNDFGKHLQTGVSYPAADPNSLAVGAVWDSNEGRVDWADSTDYTTGADRITSFSQRHPEMMDIMAPGAFIHGASHDGGMIRQGGTSQASPHIAGIAALAQQVARERLGRRLTVEEFKNLMHSTGDKVFDGDDEHTSVPATNTEYDRVNAYALIDAIWNMKDNVSSVPGYTIDLRPGDTLRNVNFGFETDAPASFPAGDANRDGLFNSSDLVQVFSAGKFESNQAATWAEGDWNGDGSFNSSDLVEAFKGGAYTFAAVPNRQSVDLSLVAGFEDEDRGTSRDELMAAHDEALDNLDVDELLAAV